MRFASAAILVLALLPGPAYAQGEQPQPPKMNADEIALLFLAGRYVMPVTCKLADGTSVEVDDAIEFKDSPEAGGGKSLRVTFFGIQVPNAEFCYSAIDRRAPDRRGVFFIHFRSRNRPDFGMADFRRLAKAGPLTYNAHRGELRVSGVGTEAATQAPSVLHFDGGDARLSVESVVAGTDGARVVAQFLEKHPTKLGLNRRIFTLRFFPKEGGEFLFYAIEDDRRFR
jgi:hypothetical protein